MKPKYRLLTKEELEILRPEFIQYLSSNGIDADKWKDILSKDLQEMNYHISAFSNVVVHRSLEKIKFIEHITSNSLKLFCFGQEKAELIMLKSKTIDLEKIEEINNESLKHIDLYRANKIYDISRENEIYNMLEQGCYISKGDLFYKVKNILGK